MLHLATENEHGLVMDYIVTAETVIRCPCHGENSASTALLSHQSEILKMETAGFPETLAYFYRTVWSHSLEHHNFNIQCYENIVYLNISLIRCS